MRLLVQAEIAHAMKEEVVERLYKAACKSADNSQFLQHTALGNELLALYYLENKVSFGSLSSFFLIVVERRICRKISL